MRITRNKTDTNDDILWKLTNNYGSTVSIAHNYKNDNNEIMFTRWHNYQHLLHLDQDEWVPGTRETRQQFIDSATHRTLLDIEILLDIDDKFEMPHIIDSSARNDGTKFGRANYEQSEPEKKLKGVPQKTTIKEKAQAACKLLDEWKLDYTVSWTGSKSYHISILFPELRQMKRHAREKWRDAFLQKFGADPQKKTERSMIALEGTTHYRSGQPKTEVTLT